MTPGPRIAQERVDTHRQYSPTADPSGQRKLRARIHAARANEGKTIIHLPPGTVLTQKDVQKEIDREDTYTVDTEEQP